MQYWAQAQAQMQQLNSAMAMVNGGAQVGTNGGVSTNAFHGNDERRENRQVKEEEFTQAGGENRQGAGVSNHMMNGAMGGVMGDWSADGSYMPSGYQT
jgi:hypothetical protein